MKSITSFILIFIFYFLFSPVAHAATLYSGSGTQVVYEGQTFVVDWYLDTEGQSINVVDLKLLYSTDTLQVTEAESGNSLVSLWVKAPIFDNNQGLIELTGGIPNGVNAKQAPLFRTTFEAIKTGNAQISLEDNSAVLRSDGAGSREPVKFNRLEFSIVDKNLQPVTLNSSTHPDQNRWYQYNNVKISFDPISGTEYSFSFSSNPEIFPDDIVDETNGNYEFNNLPDGLYYFKLSSKVGPSNWQEAGVYRVQIDNTAPEEFTPMIASVNYTNAGREFLSFATLDKTSGMSHYMVKVGLFGRFKQANSPYTLNRPLVGDSIETKAVDSAGNERIISVPYKGYISVLWFKVILISIGVLILSLIILNKKKIAK